MSTLSADKKALLAQRLRRREETRVIPPRDPAAPLVLSPAQERLWFLEQYRPGTTTYTVPLTVRLQGDLDDAVLEDAFHRVAARHEVFRTRFAADDEGVPVVTLRPEAGAEFLLRDAGSEDEAREIIETALKRPFDLEHGPLLRALVVRLSPADRVLLLAAHHLVTDGWSHDIVLSELLALAKGDALKPAPQVAYADYAVWQRDRDHTRDVAHWREHLAGVPVLDLPTDRPRPPEMGHAGAMYEIPVDVAIARDGTVTPYMVLLAAFQVLLGRYTGQDDFAVASPSAGRSVPELDDVAGMFVNTLAMRADLAGDPTFTELVARVRDRALDAYAHQELPFDRLVQELEVERDVSRSPIAQVTMALQNWRQGLDGHGLTLTPFRVEAGVSRFDLSLYLYERPGGYWAQFAYNTDLFDRATIERFAGHFSALLAQVVADPGRPISAYPLPAGEALAFSDGGPVSRAGNLLHDVVDGPADRVAIRCDGVDLTYGDLADRSDALAARLRDLGAGRDSRVAVCLEQSAEIAVAILGVLKAGAAYVPLDPAQPDDRLAYLVDDAGIDVAVTRRDLPGVTHTVTPGERGLAALPEVSETDLAYVIYTSGTTGRPKGVAVQHRQILTYLSGVRERLAPKDHGSYALLQSLSFDFGITVFYLSLMTGGTLTLLNPRLAADELAVTLRDSDYLKITPSHLASLLPEADVLPRELLLLGGEASPAEWAASLRRPGLRVVNHYGPTEATVGVTTHDVHDDEKGLLPIGRPLPGARVHVLDPAGNPCPVGVPGEIHLGGDRLARGYLNRPALTAEKFVPDPSGEPGARMYRTGDLGRWLPSGELQFLGRRDLQVKVRGYRVELAEIEIVLADREGVAQAVVELRDDRLVAYLVGESRDLRAELADLLPDYMIPSRYVWLDALPLKSHGKVDRAALPDPGTDRQAESVYVPPANALEQAIADVWAAVLNVDQVGAEDDFFALGGHSLLAAQVVAKLRRVTERPVTIMDIFKHRTVRALAARTDDGPRRLLHRLTPPRRTTTNLVCVPYGGGSAAIYQPLADALPEHVALYSVAVPGQEWGLDEEGRPIPEVADECAREILERVPGPIALYGHCGLGVMLAVEITRRLEAAGREVEVLHLGGVFPFSRPGSLAGRVRTMAEKMRSDRMWANGLIAAGLDVEELDDDQLRAIIKNRREGTREAEAYFTRLWSETGGPVINAPIVAVVGERDPATEFYQERFREWLRLAPASSCVVLDEAGHFFLKHRAEELAEIVTTREVVPRTDESTWWTQATSAEPVADEGPKPSMKRFGAVAAGQLISIIGSALTEFAVPLWIYVTTGSLVNFALFSVIGLLPGMLVAPFAGVIVDRYDRRKVMLAGDVGAWSTQLALGVLLWTGNLEIWAIYPLLAALSVALTFQRLAYGASIPQLVPKRLLGHANGVVQMVTGSAQLIVPLIAAGLMATIGLEGILVIDVASYTFAIVSVLLVRFPRTMGLRRRETIWAEMVGGFRYTWFNRSFRAMLLFFAGLNVFLSPLFLLLSPLVLAFGGNDLDDVGRVSFAGGVGVLLGGLAVALWGGPRRHRMRGMLLATLGLAVFCAVTGLQQNLVVIAIGAFGMSLALTVVNGVYATIIQVKVPQRFHGRVIALNTLVAWSTLPLAFGVVAPFGSEIMENLVDGPKGAGIAFLYVVFAAAIALIALVALRIPRLARFDTDVPDAPPDDLIGLQAVADRREAAASRT
ncbi:non-ribosomal peptide synthetase/MFS transporter [Herbidospora cretacea]|uniref:non-ribosomal peptide synthetase/MFS transporter n=1 Tax=Herbidospora cretacea TaxID=28444 RepID=UPI0007744833|nr:non-ribosomal peptide synthetase/MFS transporter [Herbidospora cretacea]